MTRNQVAGEQLWSNGPVVALFLQLYMSRIRIGILFGGSSREREVSFAGGRTVYDNLDKTLFEAVPIFIDSFSRFILLDWEYVYKGSIRDFYPPASFLPELPNGYQVYAESLNPDATQKIAMANSVGKEIPIQELPEYMDFAFLALHGLYGEDGSIQGILEWLKIPYSGSGIFASSLGMNKALQKDFQERAGLYVNQYQILRRDDWVNRDTEQRGELFKYYNFEFAERFVIKPANQGSSLGVSVLKHPDFDTFEAAMDLAFFRQTIYAGDWNQQDTDDKIRQVKQITDIRSGLGLPLKADGELIYMPDALKQHLDQRLTDHSFVLLEALETETSVVIEEFLEGREFSCIVIRDEYGNPLALPPTEIKKSTDFFDYRSKYLPGLSHKETPINASDQIIGEIREACVSLFSYFGFNVYARIDGFVTKGGEVFLNDPNTTSGMMPSSFFFHQAAEIGFNPSRFLTYIIRTSLAERLWNHPAENGAGLLLKQLDAALFEGASQREQKKRIAVIMGGYSYERHISMESGRNIYEKLSSSTEYEPIPLFLVKDASGFSLYRMPVNIMLKDNADDIREKLTNFKHDAVLDDIIEEASGLIAQYVPEGAVFEPEKLSISQLPEVCDGVFIALHGRPGEDGTLQQELRRHGLYFNGSESQSAAITINKYETNKILREHGFLVADHRLISKQEWQSGAEALASEIVQQFGLPLIAKPSDDGCSAAVRKVKTEAELGNFMKAIFRNPELPDTDIRAALGLLPNEEFPAKDELLIEKFIDKGGAARFLEVTGGMVTHRESDGSIRYEVFEPSESLAETEILSLEEKFLAGQGQNITPSRFSSDPAAQNRISSEVKRTLEAVAKTLNVTGYCRIDAFVRILPDGKVETIIIEVNSLPGMTPATCIYHQAAINGYKPFEFIREILTFGEQNNAQHA